MVLVRLLFLVEFVLVFLEHARAAVDLLLQFAEVLAESVALAEDFGDGWHRRLLWTNCTNADSR